MDPTQSGRSARGARKSAVFGNSVRSLMLVLLTTSHPAWLPVALAQPVPGGPEYTTNNQLLPPVVMDSTGNPIAVWKSFGYNMLIFIAGLQAVPEELYDAAAIDGAGAFRRFFSITLPMLAPTLVFISVITMIGYFQLFAEPYVMTQGGPLRSTTSVVLLMYEEGFRWWRMGYAASIAFVLFIVILVMTLLQFRLQRERA